MSNTINWGKIQGLSYSPETNLTGTAAAPSFTNTKSIALDGVDDYVDCGTVAGLNSASNFCASVWFKYTGTLSGTDNIMLSGGSVSTNDFYIQPTNATTIRYQVASANTNFSVTSMAQNTWIHLFLAHIGTTVTLYMNGVSQGSATRTIPTSIGTDFSIGRYSLLGGIYYFQGNIDEVAVWNTDQSANVSAIYNSGVPNDIASLSPLSWWRCGDGDTAPTLTDNGSGGNNGTMTNFSTFSTDVPVELFSRKSIALDGVDDYVEVADADNLSFGDGSNDSPFSISTWWKMDNSNGFRAVQKYSSSYEYRINTIGSSGILKCQLYDNSNTVYIGRKSDVGLSGYVGQWINVIVTYDGSSLSSGIKLYLNGSLLASTDDSNGSYTAMHNTTSVFRLGNLAGNYADGLMDETAVFNSELSASDVTAIYGSGVPTSLSSYSSLISWWRCGDGDTSPTLTDNGSGGNNGTMTNFTTFSTDVPT